MSLPVNRDRARPRGLTAGRVLDMVAGPLLASVGGQPVAALDVAEVFQPCQLGGGARGDGLGLLGDFVVLGGAIRDRAQDGQVGARVADALALTEQVARLVVQCRVLGEDTAGDDVSQRPLPGPCLVPRGPSESR